MNPFPLNMFGATFDPSSAVQQRPVNIQMPQGVNPLGTGGPTPAPVIPGREGVTIPTGTPPYAPIPLDVAPKVEAPASGHAGGFSLGNILTALIGSNFGAK